MATTATLSGTVNIATIAIPVDTKLPPTSPGNFKFEYHLPKDKVPDQTLSLKDFFDWAKDNLSSPVSGTDLPQGLQTLGLAVSDLLIDTGAKTYELGVMVGSINGGKWDSTWIPLPGILDKFTLTNMKLDLDVETTP
jgi:hypothetical protein